MTSRTTGPALAGARVRRVLTPRTMGTAALVALLGFAIVYPLVRLLGIAFIPGGHFTLATVDEVVEATWFLPALANTAIVVGSATVLAVVIGTFLAWVNARTDGAMGWFGQLLPLAPIVVPPLAIATGWAVLGQPHVGLLEAWLEKVPGIGPRLPSILSYPGLIFVMTLVLVPYVFLVLQSAFRNLDPALEEASLASGAGVVRTLWRVSIPALRNTIAAAALLAIVMGVAEYAVPLIIGTPARIDIMSVETVQFVTASYPPQLGQGAVVGLLMLVVTGSVWMGYLRIAKRGNFAQLGGRAAQTSVLKLGVWRWPARAAMVCFFLLASALPLLALVVVTLQPYWNPHIDPAKFTLANLREVFATPQLAPAIFNSAKFAAIGALIATALVMYLTSAAKIRRQATAQVGLGVVKIPAAIAHLVLGVGFLIAFYGPPFNLGDTTVMLLGAYVVIFLPQASILGEAATSQVKQDLIEASSASGASWARTHFRVLAPLTAPGFLAAYALLFALIAGEASVSRILAGPGTNVVGFAIIEQYQTGVIGDVAALAMMVSLLNLVVVGLLTTLGRLRRKGW